MREIKELQNKAAASLEKEGWILLDDSDKNYSYWRRFKDSKCLEEEFCKLPKFNSL